MALAILGGFWLIVLSVVLLFLVPTALLLMRRSPGLMSGKNWRVERKAEAG
jgi:hypothetical protein